MNSKVFLPIDRAKYITAAFILFGLYLTSLYSYLLFHTLAEMISIIIAGAIFVLAWNFRRFYKDSFLLFIGCAYLAAASIDLIHTLAFKGMGIFVGYDSNLPTQLWIAARYLQSISLLIAPLFLGRRVRIEWLLAGFGMVVALLVAAIFANLFPVCYVEGVGLTPFKVVSEYIIDLILALSIVHLHVTGHSLDRKVLRLVTLTIAFTMLGELAFTFYISVYGFSNLIGHIFKIIAFFLVYKAAIETEAGAIYTVVTQLRETERALRESELTAQRRLAELRDIYAHTPVGLCYLDGELRFQAVNDALASMDGLPADQHAGKAIGEVLPWPLAAPMEPVLREVLSSGNPVLDLEICGRSSPDETGLRHWLVSIHPLIVNGAGAVGLSCVIQDVTERRSAEQAREASEQKLRLFIEYAPTAIAMLDRDMRYIAASRRYLADYRLGEQDLTGRSHYEIFPEISEDWKEIHRRCLAGAVEKREEDPFPRADGTLDWVRWEIHPWRDNRGEVGGIIIFSEVITERKQSQEALARMNESLHDYTARLKRSNQELEQFAFVASHDLQEPLRKIKMFGERLDNQFNRMAAALPAEETETALDYLTRVRSAAGRMQSMIDGLLELSRVNTRGGNFEPVQLTTLVQEVVADLEARIHATGGQVIVEELPSAEADLAQMRRLFQNLIGNALKFHRPGVPPVIRVSGSVTRHVTRGTYLTLCVEDNGIGFDEQHTARIFQPFQRLHGRQEFDGTGLGLSICQRIVERHQGSITARSRLGEGSVFIVTMPVKQGGG